MSTRMRPATSNLHRGYIPTRTRRRPAPSTCIDASLCNGDRGSHLSTSAVGTTPSQGVGGRVGHGRLGANKDGDTDDEVEAREGGDLGEDEALIGRCGDDTVDAAGGRCRGGGWGARRGARKGASRVSVRKTGRARGGPIAAGGQRQGEALCLLRLRHVRQ